MHPPRTHAHKRTYKRTQDRSFTFVLKTPPASVLLKEAAGIDTGSGTPNKTKVGSVTMAKVKVRDDGRPLPKCCGLGVLCPACI